MGFWKRLFGAGGEHKNSGFVAAKNQPQRWFLNADGFPTLESGKWRFFVTRYEGRETPLWQYCAVKDGVTEWSYYTPSEKLAKAAAELHLKLKKAPPFGIIELAEADEENFDIVGESNYQDALETIAGPKSRSGAEFEVEALLVPEPDNKFDRHAVMVIIDDHLVGYIPRNETADFHEFLDQTGASSAICDAIIEGGWKNEDSEGRFCVRLNCEWPPYART